MASSARIDELRKKFDENPRRYFAPLANEYRKAGDLEQAIFICQEYLPQQPGHMSGHIVYGQALFEQGQFDAARGVFETALSLDPENLIALRHLGDIARQAGDTSSARIWYQRVLEADPRNEEIAQLMMSLLSTPAGSPVVDHSAPTPLSTPVVGGVETTAPARPTPINTYTPLAETASVEGIAPSPFSPAPAPEPMPESFISRHAPSEDELLDLDSFDLGGVPLSSLRSTKADDDVGFAPTPPNSEAVPFIGDSVEALADTPEDAGEDVRARDDSVVDQDGEPEVEIEKSEEFSDEFEADPYAVAARVSDESSSDLRDELDAAIEVTAGVDLSEADTDALPSSQAPSDEPQPSDATVDGAAVDGLEVFESGVIAGRPSSAFDSVDAVDELATEPFYDAPAEVADDDSGFIDDATAFIATPIEEAASTEDAESDAPVVDDQSDEIVVVPTDSADSTEPVVASESVVEGALDVAASAATEDDADIPEPVAVDIAATEIETADAAADEVSAGESLTVEDPAVEDPAVEDPAVEEDAIDALVSELPSIEVTDDEVEHEPDAVPAPIDDTDSVDEPQVALPPTLGTPRFNVAMTESPSFPESSGSPPFGAVAAPDTMGAMEAMDETFAVAPESVETAADASLSMSDEEAGAAASTPAFVTETMAALYLEQGHYDAALDIYRQLVAQRPEDIDLRDRLHAAEARAWGKSQELGASIVEDETVALGDSPAPSDYQPAVFDGPTIRDFLASVIFRRAIDDAGPTQSAYADDAAVAVEELGGGDDAVAAENATDDSADTFERADVEASVADVQPSSIEHDTVRGSLGALFSEADAAEQAVSEPLTTRATPLAGAPAHRAVSELSLDHVFKTNAAPRRSTDEFSFDQFFSDESTASEASTPVEPPSPEASAGREPSDDIAQFNAWLNGLKKP